MNIFSLVYKINWLFIFLLILVSSIGVGLLYSIAGGEWNPWALNQIIRILIGVLLLLFAASINIKIWYKNSYYIYFFCIFLILITLFFSREISGATRWLDLYFFSIQPAEILKIFVILTLAKYFHSIKLQSFDIKHRILFPLLILLLPVTLVFKQPDLGTALIIFFSGIVVFFLAGVKAKVFLGAGILGTMSMPVLWSFLKDYQKSRIINFLDQQSDVLGANYHITQSKISLGSGGLFGKGFLQGTQSHLSFVPEMQTDFIFSVLGEEFGFFGIFMLFIIYAIIMFWAIRICLNSRNYFSKIFGISFVSSFFLSIFVNVGMVTGIIPVVGVPLPLCSYGGSAMISYFIGFGILLSGYNFRDNKLENI